jgi:hypothetical protein
MKKKKLLEENKIGKNMQKYLKNKKKNLTRSFNLLPPVTCELR